MIRIGLKRQNTEEKNLKKLKKICDDTPDEINSSEHAKVIPLGNKLVDAVERRLEVAVFGEEDDIIKNIDRSHEQPHHKLSFQNKSEEEQSDNEESDVDHKPKPAWEDDDDESEFKMEIPCSIVDKSFKVTVKKNDRKNFVKKKFTQVMGEQPSWAKLKHERQEKHDSQDEDDSGDEFLQKTGDVLNESSVLMKGTINISKCTDINRDCRDISIIKQVEFHPTAQVAAVAGVSGSISIMQVDGKVNPKIQTIHFDNFAIEKAHFTRDGEEIIAVSKNNSHYFSYDMIKGSIRRIQIDRGMEQQGIRNFEMSPDGKFMVIFGRFGNIHILTAKSKECISTVKMNGEVSSLTFNSSGTHMYSYGSDGEVYVWDTRDWGHCIHRFHDDGCIYGTSLCLSPNQQYLVCGSRSGVVNIYDTNKILLKKYPKPEKILYNMTTEVNDLKFNSTSELMVMSSWKKDNAIKLVHFPSMTVFSNFPSFNTSLRRPQNVDLSVNSGYLTIANNTGRAFLYRLKHYDNY